MLSHILKKDLFEVMSPKHSTSFNDLVLPQQILCKNSQNCEVQWLTMTTICVTFLFDVF